MVVRGGGVGFHRRREASLHRRREASLHRLSRRFSPPRRRFLSSPTVFLGHLAASFPAVPLVRLLSFPLLPRALRKLAVSLLLLRVFLPPSGVARFLLIIPSSFVFLRLHSMGVPPLATSPFLRRWLVGFPSTMRCARAIGRVPAPSSGTLSSVRRFVVGVRFSRREAAGRPPGHVAPAHWFRCAFSRSLIGRPWQVT